MWVEKKRSWIANVVLGGAALPRIWMRTLAVSAVSIVVTVVTMKVPQLHYSVTTTPFVLIGLPLGIFLGFRNNAAYDRFWEARKAWGQLVNTSRSLARQLLTLVEPAAAATERDPASVRAHEVFGVHILIAFVHALRHHLRDASPFETLERVLPREEVDRLREEENVPIALLQRLGDHMADARRKCWLDPLHAGIIEQSLVHLTDVQGACERIKLTPIPYSYNVLLHRIVGVYCGLLPFGMADTIGWATPAVVLAISYAFFGLDSVGDEIEQPFGLDTNDLPLKAVSYAIERNLRARIGEEGPAPVKPRGGVLV